MRLPSGYLQAGHQQDSKRTSQIGNSESSMLSLRGSETKMGKIPGDREN